MSQTLRTVDAGSFDHDVLSSSLPVAVEFGAAWCPPCRAIEPHLRALAEAYAGRVHVATCDADANGELAARYDVRALPTVLVFKGGTVVGQVVGAVPRPRLEALLTKAL